MNLKMTENNTDSTISIEETSKSLKETLRAQQQLLQKLYNELDVEREASSSAASEALAMILRLQGEKASVKMESEHYKRLAEEKMCYAEESMNIFEEQIHQREMEIASLDCQLQAYRYKLQSLGFVDNETSSLSRRNSAPPKLLKLAYLYRHRSRSPDSDLGEDENHQNFDSERQCYWDQIRKLDKIVEEMADEEHIKQSGKSSQINEIEQVQNVHDVFEVPEINIDVKDNGKLIMEGESNFEKVLVFPEEAISMLVLKQKDKEGFLPRGDVAVDCHMAVVEGPSQQVNTAMEITEECEIEDEGKKEVLRLLHEINEKLDSIKSEIKSGNTKIKKPSPNYDLPMLQLQEAMLHFWL